MKCDRCDNEATVHEVTIHKGQKVEKHLCEQCAQEDGIAVQSQSIPSSLLQQFTVGLGQQAPSKPSTRTPACGTCGMTYAEFRQHGLLGCPDCYHAFEKQLTPLLERAQEGGADHIGKTPNRSVGALQRERKLTVLRKQLADALAAEHYERAAELRDELRDAGADVSPSSAMADNDEDSSS